MTTEATRSSCDDSDGTSAATNPSPYPDRPQQRDGLMFTGLRPGKHSTVLVVAARSPDEVGVLRGTMLVTVLLVLLW
jgi:hypothetical protein